MRGGRSNLDDLRDELDERRARSGQRRAGAVRFQVAVDAELRRPYRGAVLGPRAAVVSRRVGHVVAVLALLDPRNALLERVDALVKGE